MNEVESESMGMLEAQVEADGKEKICEPFHVRARSF